MFLDEELRGFSNKHSARKSVYFYGNKTPTIPEYINIGWCCDTFASLYWKLNEFDHEPNLDTETE